MKAIRMKAKKAGTCTACQKSINVGQTIIWQRGAGARHYDCEQARISTALCTVCKGAGADFRNVPCRSCDGTGSRDQQDYQRGLNKPLHDDPGYIEGGNYGGGHAPNLDLLLGY